jgi:carbon-monoxide dehydrogenase iron sulfur subunit
MMARAQIGGSIRWEDSGRCTGCCACEIACSFHKGGVFQPTRASIHVQPYDADGCIFLELSASCDHCSGMTTPYCVRYCPPDALTERLLAGFWDRLGEPTGGEI